MSDALQNGFHLGVFEVLPREERIRGPDGEQHLEPRVMQVLLVLARNAGTVVTRERLLDEVWGDVVVGDEVLSRAVSLLRAALGDQRTRPRFIRTVPRRGYELVAPVAASAPVPVPVPARTPSPDPDAEAVVRRFRLGRAGTIAVGLLLAGLAVTAGVLVGRGSPDPMTVAVLPPSAAAEDAELGFVGEGLAEYLIDQLGRSRGISVVARRSSFGLRDTDANVRAIGEELGARYLVDGSLREEGSGLLLTLFLVDTATGTNVWTARLHGTDQQVGLLQRDAGRALGAALRDTLGVAIELPAASGRPVPEQAYRKYLEARYQWTLRGERRIARSIALLEEALAIEPDYAAAHLALAQSVAIQPLYTDAPLAPHFRRARMSAGRALSLDPTLEADVAALEGFMLTREWRWSEAQQTLRRALALDADNVDARYWYSLFLSQLGRYQEALEQMVAAQRLDPVSAVLNDRLALAYVWTGDLAKAAARYRAAEELGYLESTQPLSLMLFLYRSGQLEALERLLLRIGGTTDWVRPVVAALGDPAARQVAIDAVDNAPPNPTLDLVRFGIWVLLGATDRAFRDFRADPKLPYVEVLWAEDAEHLRADPRFETLLARINLAGRNRELIGPALHRGAATVLADLRSARSGGWTRDQEARNAATALRSMGRPTR